MWNQAFRKEQWILNSVNYDMTESYGFMNWVVNKTINVKNKWTTKAKVTKYFSISENEFTSTKTRRELFKNTFFYLWDLQKKKNTYVDNSNFKYIYMNYAAPEYKDIWGWEYQEVTPKNAINFWYAFAKLAWEYEFTERQAC